MRRQYVKRGGINVYIHKEENSAINHLSFHLKLEKKSKLNSKLTKAGFPGGAVIKNLPANAGDTGSNPGPGRSHMPRSN